MNKKLNNKSLYILIGLSITLIIILLFSLKDYLFIFNNLFLYLFLCLLFINIVGIILIIVSLNSDIKYIKNIGLVIVIISLIISIGGSILLFKVNRNINNTYVDDSYYELEGYISYNKNTHNYKDISELKDLENLNVGVIRNDDNDYLGKDVVDDLFNKYNIIYYDDDFTLYKDLIDDNSLDIGIFSNHYRMAVKNSSEYKYYEYIDEVSDLYSFKEKIKDNKDDLNGNVYNILLIGYAPESEDESLGLADGIMLASVNLDSLKINLTSIARSSEVTYACNSGIRDRINSTINYGEKCLVDTSSELLGVDIDYYIEVNFNGLVKIVDALGGITVNNNKEFVGQTSSAIRGEETVYVPSGENVYLNGEQALAYARERYVYSDENDLTRQSNQQEVLTRIIEKLLNNKNIFKLLDVIDVLGDNVKTNINKKQLLNILNKVSSLNDNTGVSLFNKLDIDNNQLVGKYIESYNYYMRSPIWVYKIYDKSIEYCNNNMLDALDVYDGVKQESYLKFFGEYPYFYIKEEIDYSSLSLEETLPNYYPNLIGLSKEEVIAWANSSGVELTIDYINKDDDKYDSSKIGRVISQSINYGSLVYENTKCDVEVIEAE